MFLNCPGVCDAATETELMRSTSHTHIVCDLIQLTSIVVRTAW